jgi:hypothetical protein
MLSNLALAMQSNGRTVRQLKQSQSTSQLMKNNKSLTSSPCDDMNAVPIAEQKAKDSVGKENGVNLSDHESSESNGDMSSDLYNPHHWLHLLHFYKVHFPSTLKISSSFIDLH